MADQPKDYQDIINRAKQKGEEQPPERKAPMKLVGDAPAPPRALSPETLAGIAEMSRTVAQRPAPAPAATPPTPTETATSSPPTPQPPPEFAFLDGLRRSEMEQLRKKRKAIEERLIPLKIEDLILNDEVTQVVPIMDGLEVEFRSISGDEDIAIKRMISFEDERLSELYVQSKLGMFILAASIVRINEKVLPIHMVDTDSGSRRMDEKVFQEKYNRLLRRPAALLSELATQNTWFQQRLQNVFSQESLKNG